MNLRKVLIAIDASENSQRAVEYAARMLGGCNGCFAVQLLCVLRPPDRDMFPDEESWKAGCDEKEEGKKAFMAKARAILEAEGVRSEDISERYLCGLGPSIASHILDVGREGDFGTLVVGRRGVSKQEEFLFGSVSNKIVHYAKDCTAWVVQ